MIRDHKWRPLHTEYLGVSDLRVIDDRPCAYLSCRKHRSEHRDSVTLRDAR